MIEERLLQTFIVRVKTVYVKEQRFPCLEVHSVNCILKIPVDQ